MAKSQFRSRRKSSGGRYTTARSKKKYELAGYSANTTIGESRLKSKRVIGGNEKRKILRAEFVNAANKGKITKTKILNVVENSANKNLVRRNIITKGCIVETELGKVLITSRPGQTSVINGKTI